MLSSLHRFAPVRDERCIWTTPLWKMTTRSFLALHESMVRGQIVVSCAGCAACLGVAERGEASDGETAALCAGAVVRNGCCCRRCERRWLRVARDRESRNADLEPWGGRRRGGCER